MAEESSHKLEVAMVRWSRDDRWVNTYVSDFPIIIHSKYETLPLVSFNSR